MLQLWSQPAIVKACLNGRNFSNQCFRLICYKIVQSKPHSAKVLVACVDFLDQAFSWVWLKMFPRLHLFLDTNTRMLKSFRRILLKVRDHPPTWQTNRQQSWQRRRRQWRRDARRRDVLWRQNVVDDVGYGRLTVPSKCSYFHSPSTILIEWTLSVCMSMRERES